MDNTKRKIGTNNIIYWFMISSAFIFVIFIDINKEAMGISTQNLYE